MSKYIMYLRKSRQDDPSETVEEVLARHEKQLQDYAVKTFGYRISESDIYREIISGESLEERIEIQKVFKRIESKEVLGVLVIEPQRLTRGDLLDCGTVVHIFRYSNTLIVTPPKTYNLEDKFDRKFFEMELSKGGDFLEYIKEVLNRGKRASALNEGNYIASVPPYGYNRVKVGKHWTLAINEHEAEYVKLIFKWYSEGIGMTTIANRLVDLGAKPKKAKIFTVGTLRDMLSNEVYIGKIIYQRKKVVPVIENGKLVKKTKKQNDYEVVDGKHEPIIDLELFNKVQELRGRTSKYKTGTELKNVYATILRCKCCGKAMNYSTYDTCAYKRPPRYTCRSGKHCDNRSIYFDKINDAICKSLKATLDDFELKLSNDTKELFINHENIIKNLEKELAALEVRQEELYEYLEKKIYTQDVFLMRNDKLAQERIRIKESIKKARESMPTVHEFEEKIASLHTALDMLNDDSVSVLSKNTFLKSFIDHIDYQRTKDEQVYVDIFLK